MLTGSAPVTILTIKNVITELNKRFNDLKNTFRECLEKRKTCVKEVADMLTSMSADDNEDHKIFPADHVSFLFDAANLSEQFGTMNFHLNYLCPNLLDHIVTTYDLKEVKSQMEAYKSDLQQFRMKTSLSLFCQVQRQRHQQPPNFQTISVLFDWPENVTLEDVEQFRQEYASHYNLRDCAMMIAQVRSGSFIITWFIPQSVVEKLKTKVPRAILKKYSVTRLEIAGVCVYRLRQPQEVSVSGCTSSV